MMTYQELKDQENQYVMHTYGRFSIALDHGKGAQLWDVEGKRYIDLTSGIGVCCLGYDNEKIVNAITEQAHKLMHVSNLFTTAPMVQVAKTLVEQTGMGKVFFANSGAEANEGMIKLARKYSYDKYGEGRAEIVTLRNSFHGRTVTTLKATGQDKFHQYFFPFTEGFAYAEANNMDSIRANVNEHTCAVMMELIQGEGGVMPLDQSFVQEVAAFCKERDLLLLIDEVQTGIGRTGSLFCFQQYGIKPDVVSMAKGLGGGLPVGACLATEKFGSTLTAGTHGTTFGGNPVVLAGAIEILNRIDDEFLKSVREKGEYIKNKVIAFNDVSEVRGMGLMIGVDLKTKKAADVAARCVENGLLILTAKQSLRMLPPLTVTENEIDPSGFTPIFSQA